MSLLHHFSKDQINGLEGMTDNVSTNQATAAQLNMRGLKVKLNKEKKNMIN